MTFRDIVELWKAEQSGKTIQRKTQDGRGAAKWQDIRYPFSQYETLPDDEFRIKPATNEVSLIGPLKFPYEFPAFETMGQCREYIDKYVDNPSEYFPLLFREVTEE